MRIDDMSLDQATDAMTRISAALAVVCEDEDVQRLIDELADGESGSWISWIPKYLPRITSLVFRKHRESFYEVIGALAQQDAKTVGEMNSKVAVELLRENWGAITDFFSSSESSATKIEKQSA